MASYREAVEWIAAEDAGGDTPVGLDFETAFERVDGALTVVMVADLWGRDPKSVAVDVLKARGFKAPRGFLSRAAA
ncbi:hypothetical protein ACE15N_22115 (plasmid) [Xanthomonas campestris pv. passiflorae]|jgi:hypothetical protein|uniref:hypothetical protein n=1 Tax=Xanthomonas TaxID=338 RepID=UPI0002EA5CAB|nr:MULTISPECIES: hypothetical protein [Xanthomonas]KGT55145.1 hypothetical protein NY96_13445 [Xanthomonas citri pv. fuscans]